MTADELELARRVVKSPGWTWVAGMAVALPPLFSTAPDTTWRVECDEFGHVRPVVASAVPDLSDPVTCAALAVVARLALDEPRAYADPWCDARWIIQTRTGDMSLLTISHGPTEAAAWVEAICTAPAKP